MSAIDGSTTLRELAFIVGEALYAAGINAVLSGGGAATFYAPEAYQSGDLDFVLDFWSSHGINDAPILALGFVKRAQQYGHPNTIYTLDIVLGPVAIGNDDKVGCVTVIENGKRLRILSPTDCVRDRLAHFISWKDHSGLRSAVAVAVRHEVDFRAIRSWCESERSLEPYLVFMDWYVRAKS
ncbi:MAG: hypothetical protein ACOYON_01895 [Fimbriimonas sp.]